MREVLGIDAAIDGSISKFIADRCKVIHGRNVNLDIHRMVIYEYSAKLICSRVDARKGVVCLLMCSILRFFVQIQVELMNCLRWTFF